MDRISNVTAPRDAAGDETIIGALDAYRQYLLMVADREIDADLRAKGGASDIVQETLLEACRDLESFRGDGHGELQAWLRRILLNNVANFRKRYRETEKRQVGRERSIDQVEGTGLVPTAGLPSPSGHAMRREEELALARGLGRLPEHYRGILVLRHREHQSFAEAARRMGLCSEEAARKLWARAVDRLRWEVERGEASAPCR